MNLNWIVLINFMIFVLGMSYSLLAGLPPAHGLYCNLFFPLFYMLFGTARQSVIGTSAIEAVLTKAAVSNVVGSEVHSYDNVSYN